MEPRQLREVLARNLRAAMAANPEIATQLQIEAKVGVGQSTISRILKCEGSATLDVIAKLASALGRQPWELLVDEEATREAALRRILGGGGESGSGQPHQDKRSAA